MAVELRLIRTLRGFEPADDASREAAKSFKIGADVKCEIRIARDGARLRYFWGLVNVILENTEGFDSKEAVATSIKFALGHVDQVQVYDEEKGWRIERSPKSISFAKMGEPDFVDFIRRAEAYACSVLSVTSDQLADALTEFMAPGMKR